MATVAAGVLALVTAASVLPADAQGGTADGRYRQFGDPGGFVNIIPPGQRGFLSPADLTQVNQAVEANDPNGFPPHYADQRAMYQALVFDSEGLTNAQLSKYYKDASFGVKTNDIDRVYHPTAGATVIRDKSFGVPHVYGTTRYATMFAEGYATAEDRLVFMDVLRRKGRGTLSALVGGTDSIVRQDAGSLTFAPYTEADFQRQVDDLKKTKEGRSIADDATAYTAGVNAYIDATKKDPSLLPAEYKTLGKQPEPWKLTDEVAIATNVGAIFGKGGGREIDNLCGIDAIAKATGSPTTARQVFDDLKFANHPGAPTTSTRVAPYNTRLGPVDPKSQPDVDCSSLADAAGAVKPASSGLGSGGGISLGPELDAFLAQLDAPGPTHMSNAILVTGAHTDNGRPIAVFGPQVGYNVPSLLVEKDVHGPGIDARGVGFLGVDFYVLLGRGRNYAWSATSAGADNVDQWVLKLCDPTGGAATTASTGYLHDGTCKKFDAFDHVVDTTTGLAGTGNKVRLTWHVERAPDYGPIVKTGKLHDGTPIAIAVQRSTYGKELRSAIGFRQFNDPRYMATGYRAFRTAAADGIDYTFNWFYVDARTVGYQQSCRCPIRAKGVDPDLPNWGTGQWDWTAYVPLGGQPHDVNPRAGYISSWNNKQAPQWRVADDTFSDGPVHRVQMLNTRLDAAMRSKRKLTRANVVSLMEDAATVDLRGQEVLPTLLRALGTTPPTGTPERVLAMREKLETWVADGAHRKAKDPGQKVYDDAVPAAVMDAWWKLLPDTVFDESVGRPVDALQLVVDDSPSSHGGSAYLDGMYGAVQQDLRQLLGDRVRGAWKHSYCGGGNLDQCRAVLWQSLAKAGDALQSEFNSPDPEQWQRKVSDDEIQFDKLLAGVLPMNWQNRPTFQQVVQVGR
ncbi:MAG: penicillin acylase family protein [Acidimicrobiia bacterium]